MCASREKGPVQIRHPYGRVYTKDGNGSLNSVKDLAGNALTVGCYMGAIMD